ncbi:PREDICTED: BPI fold-containing family A member 2-like isoform X2 [Chinchilla lanigera]|uniref:BPI fold-containing family A member 2-like isoform X2 n=1 Tax=Chinchilla lanigera TaxID=34839 RepID=UPI000695FD27|nr:PREDICTED: BPI fold-containing family A member 2-like isoform X2 [Chinchilla lanigera]
MDRMEPLLNGWMDGQSPFCLYSQTPYIDKVSGKMRSQLWKLLLLCHLLTGISEGFLFNGRSNSVGQVKPALQNVPETADSLAEGFHWQWNLNPMVFPDFIAKRKIQKTENVVDFALPHLLPSLEKSFGVRISKTVIKNIQAEQATDGRSITLRFLVTANVTAALPLICRRVNLEVSLDLLTGIRLIPVPQTNLFTVTVGEFTVDPDTITISLLDRANDMINRSMDSVIDVLKKIVSALLQNQVSPPCPGAQSKACYSHGSKAHWMVCR